MTFTEAVERYRNRELTLHFAPVEPGVQIQVPKGEVLINMRPGEEKVDQRLVWWVTY